MSPLIIFATKREAQESLNRFDAVEGDLDGYYQTSIGSILITGMGPVQAASKLSRVIDKHSEVVNIGLAGTLQEGIIGFFPVSLVGKQTFFPNSYSLVKQASFQEAFLPNVELQSEGKHLITMDYPLHCPQLRKELSKEWDLVDMEGWAIATSCRLHEKPCRLYKLVSDLPSEGSSQEIRQVIDKLSLKAADELFRIIRI